MMTLSVLTFHFQQLFAHLTDMEQNDNTKCTYVPLSTAVCSFVPSSDLSPGVFLKKASCMYLPMIYLTWICIHVQPTVQLTGFFLFLLGNKKLFINLYSNYWNIGQNCICTIYVHACIQYAFKNTNDYMYSFYGCPTNGVCTVFFLESIYISLFINYNHHGNRSHL